MNITKENILKTIEEFSNNTDYSEEDKEIVKTKLLLNDIKERDEFILKNIIPFTKSSLINDLVYSEEYITGLFDEVNENNFSILRVLNEYVNKHLLKNLFNNDKFIELYKKNSNMYFARFIDNFFDYFEINIQKEMLNLINDEYITLIDLQVLPNYKIDEILENEKNKNELFKIIKEAYVDLNNPYLENKIYSIYKNEFLLLTIKEQFEIFEHFNNEEILKKYFEEIKLIDKLEYLTYIINNSIDKIRKGASQEDLLKLCKKLVYSNNYKRLIKLLDFEHQLEFVFFLDQNKIEFDDYFIELDSKVIDYLFDRYPNSLSLYQLHFMYIETKKIKYLEKLKEIFLSDKVESIYSVDVLYENAFVGLLNDEEKKIIENKIEKRKNIPITHDYVEFNDYYFKIIAKDVINSLEEDEKLSLSISDVQKFFSNEEQNIILEHISLEKIVENILYDENNFNFIKNKLSQNEKLFSKKRIIKYPKLYSQEKIIERLDEILPYFNDEQICIFFQKEIIEKNKEVEKRFNDYIKDNIFKLERLELIFQLKISDEEKNNILKSSNIDLLVDCFVNNYEYRNILIKIISERLDDFISFINNSKFFNTIYCFYVMLNEQQKDKLVNSITNFDIMETLVNDISRDGLLNFNMLDKLINLYNDNLYKSPKIKFQNYSQENRNYIIKKLSFISLFYTTTYLSNKSITNEILERINNDFNLLFDENIFIYLNNFFQFISFDERNKIENKIDEILFNNNIYKTKYKDKLNNLDFKDKLNFLNLTNKGYINLYDNLFDMLLKKNPFIIKSIREIMFNENIITMDMHFIEKTSKYSNVQSLLKKLDNKTLKFINKASKYILKKEIAESSYDIEISRIIEYLCSDDSKLKKYDFDKINDDNIEDIINYILYEYPNCIPFKFYSTDTLNELYSFDIENYTLERIKKCDEVFYSSKDIEEMKNIYLNKYLSISIIEAEDFYKSYIMNYSKVIKYASSDIPIGYINLLNKILNITDEITLKELYEKTTISYSISDRFLIEDIMKKAYYESLANDYKDKQNGEIVTKQFKDNSGNLVSLDMVELVDNFGILVHSTCAYGQMPLIDNDYYISWNNNPNTENHGICCSYITNSSYGTAAVTDNGVMFGFTKINKTSVATYSPYDLATNNSGYNIKSRNVPNYTTLDEIPNTTRHTHNEFDLERRNVIDNQDYYCIQPDAIIITEDMPNEIKQNSIKAYEDFKKHGINLKLIYIDRVKIAQNEARKLDALINEFNITKDLNILANIINLYESNICGCDFIGMGKKESLNLFNQHELFMTDKISNILNDTLDEIDSIEDNTIRKENLKKFINILESEQAKFDLLNDFNKERKHKFELYSDELKEKIKKCFDKENNFINKRI